jgi:hypothetical protein
LWRNWCRVVPTHSYRPWKGMCWNGVVCNWSHINMDCITRSPVLPGRNCSLCH